MTFSSRLNHLLQTLSKTVDPNDREAFERFSDMLKDRASEIGAPSTDMLPDEPTMQEIMEKLNSVET